MDVNMQLNQIYLVGALVPLNDNSPPKELLGPLQTVDVNECTGNLTRIRRHFGLLLQYDAATRVGVLLLGSSQPVQQQRFVPIEETERKDFQPQHFLTLTGPGMVRSFGYFNFSHALRATVYFQGDRFQHIVPPQVYFTKRYSNGDCLDIFVDNQQIELLRELHTLYWDGIWYEDGGSGGSGGGGSIRPISADGTVCVTHSIAYENRGGSGSERLAHALEEEDERITQLSIMDGDHQHLPTPEVCCYLKPWTSESSRLINPL